MTVKISKPALNLREELTKAQSVVPYSQQQFWMDGFVENGTFDSDTSGWTAGSSALLTHSTDKLVITNNGVGYGYAYQQITGLTAGKPYTISWESPSSDPNAKISVGGIGSGGLVNATGVTARTFVATGSSTYVNLWSYTSSTSAAVDFDNVAVFEVDENDNVIHSVPLGFKPVHVYEDGLLQREGDVHDYTVVKTGGAYTIKPAVQPTGATETCVIAEREL